MLGICAVEDFHHLLLDDLRGYLSVSGLTWKYRGTTKKCCLKGLSDYKYTPFSQVSKICPIFLSAFSPNSQRTKGAKP